MSATPARNNAKNSVGKMARVRGTWRFRPNLFSTCHEHEDGTPCEDHLGHACLDSGTQDPSFIEAGKELVAHFQAPLQETIDALKLCISDLEKELALAKSSIPSMTAGMKRKLVESGSDHMDIDHTAHPAKRTPHPDPIIPVIGFDSAINPDCRPDNYVDYVLMRNSDFQAGFPLTSATLRWSFEHGTIRPTATTLAAINQGVKASPIPTTGTPAGAQTFPRNSTELVQLTNDAHTSGNWSSALRLCLLRWLAVLLDYLHSKSPSDIAFLVGVAKDCLSVNIYPQWAQFTAFINPAQYSRADDSPDSWSQHAPEVPAVASDPNMTATNEEFANAIFIHYSHAKHYGIMSNDDGSFYMPTVSAPIPPRSCSS
ncbi:hypothetical protein L218DRAFT_581326 [Marasmius fiardii PR-910]|nr:hypothetical protein L218DRAFT_581326 [Marasmius fiardii PR-910]